MEIEFVDSTKTQRTVYYAMGGAFRIIGGSDAGLYYRHADHLGSTSVVSDSTGSKLAGSEVVFAPFGEVRAGAQSDLTDFGYTGQCVGCRPLTDCRLPPPPLQSPALWI